jgi:hypothetical protein
MYVLKVRCALGHLVPLLSEHRSYEIQEKAEQDAGVIAAVWDQEVVVVDYTNDIPVFYAGSGRLV